MSQAGKVQELRAEPAEDGPKPRVQTAVRTISILLAVSASSEGLRAKDISEKLGLPRQVTYHLLHSLLGTGILRRNAQNCYVLGLAAAAVADGFRRQLEPPEELAPRVRAAVAVTGETSYASGWVDGRIAVLASARGRSVVQAAEVPHGYSAHGHARASGKLLLALSDPVTRETYLAGNPLVALTARTITSSEGLRRELEAVVRQGYAVDDEEFSEGLCCLAVPVEGLGSHFTLGIAVPSERFRANFDRYLANLRNAARLAVDAGAESQLDPSLFGRTPLGA